MQPTQEIPTAEVANWQSAAGEFPYDGVIGRFHAAGKHHVSHRLLGALDGVRAALPPEPARRCPQLERFLDTTLDKFDGRYDNPSYLALDQLGLPGADGCPDPGHAGRQRDRLLVLLLADMMRFELAALHGETDLLPEMRPAARTVAKRCRHALRAIRPALERLGISFDHDETDPVAAAAAVCEAVWEGATAAERRKLRLTAIPVSLVHDEYMFIRSLQSYEITFALIAVQLTAAVRALGRGDGSAATAAIETAERVLGQSSPLWSLVGTMQTQSFLRFREFTDGASAIQSRSYKRVESICRRPDRDRLDSPAYTSVPEVRARVMAGQPNLDDALATAEDAGDLTEEERAVIAAAMERFEAGILRWRKTHHSLAVRMLGERRGTGYTEGVGYLAQGRTIPVFKGRCPFGHG